MTSYQAFLIAVLLLWPVVIFGLLYLMHRLENYVNREEAGTPAEAGLEPVAGRDEKEVKIRFGDRIIGEPAQETGTDG